MWANLAPTFRSRNRMEMISRQPDTTIVGAKFSLISTSPPRISYLGAFEVALRTGILT